MNILQFTETVKTPGHMLTIKAKPLQQILLVCADAPVECDSANNWAEAMREH